jgi:hypothetical protein
MWRKSAGSVYYGIQTLALLIAGTLVGPPHITLLTRKFLLLGVARLGSGRKPPRGGP